MSDSATALPTKLALRISAQEIRGACEWLDSVCFDLGLPKSMAVRFDVCLHEALANVMAHGGAEALERTVEIEFGVFRETGSREAVLTVVDAGLAFDPTRAHPAKRPASLAEAEPGGLGLHMMREAADRIMYSRQSGRNRLTFVIVWDQTGN